MKRNQEAVRNVMTILPVKAYEKETEAFIMESGEYMDILEIIPRDVDGMTDGEIINLIEASGKSQKLLREDSKWVAMNFPDNTSDQQENVRYHMERTESESIRKWNQRRLQELIDVAENVTRREYFEFCYGKNKEAFLKKRMAILDTRGAGPNRSIKMISEAKKKTILFRLCNMNTLVNREVGDEEEG